MKIILMVMMISTLIGCAGGLRRSPLSSQDAFLAQVQLHLNDGEFYKARKLTESYLKAHPNDEAAEKVMAQIIEVETEREKNLLEGKVEEEYGDEEKDIQVKNWLERSRTFMQAGHYQEAVEAAEMIFKFDPDNKQASVLIDDIRRRALKEGKHELVIKGQMNRTEISDRIKRYLSQADEYVQARQWGMARLTVQKLLLIDPENKQGLRLMDEIQEALQTRQAAA